MDETLRPPRAGLARSMPYELRETPDGQSVMSGHLAVFNEWTEIESRYEGRFLERVAPGAFAKTMQEWRDRIKILFNHGSDPSIGKKVLGSIRELVEDETGAYYEVGLLDTAYVRDLIPGLRGRLYGASFQFDVLKEDVVKRPARSAHNPEGLTERTLTEVKLFEFGPVTFPAYEGATAGVRSTTDDLLLAKLQQADHVYAGRTSFDVPGQREAREQRRYQRCASYVGETFWAIHPPALAVILEILRERANGEKPSPEEIQERIGERSAPETVPAESPVAVINITGSIIPHASLFGDISGATSIERLQAEFRAALANPAVHAILLNVDSPGGSVDLVPEFAQEIRDARGTKPITAIANTMAASAAYFIASAADEVIVTPSGDVGSIGVYSIHQDLSEAQAKAGIKTTVVSAGEFKTERNPYEPLSEEAQAEMQATVDAYYKMFVDAVAKGRDATAETVRDMFGQGRMVMATEAVNLGMADKVATYQETLRRLTKQATTAAAKAAKASATSEPESPVATTRPSEPEPSVATTQKPRHLGGQPEQPQWRL